MNRRSPNDEAPPEPSQPGVGPLQKLTPHQLQGWLEKRPDWRVEEGHHLLRTYRFPDFVSALDRIQQIGAVAETLDHHPDLELSWGRVGVKIFTHSVDGLTDADLQLAAGIEALEGSQ